MKHIVKIIARIETESGGFIGISQGDYGRYFCLWFDRDLVASNLAPAAQWFWATTWGRPIEHGNWAVRVPGFGEQNVVFNDTFNNPDLAVLEDHSDHSLEEWFYG